MTKATWHLRQCSLIGSRELNEDVVLVDFIPMGKKGAWLCIVSDGMGGMEGGACAAQECTRQSFSTAQKVIADKGKALFYQGGGKVLQSALEKMPRAAPSAKGGATLVLLALCLDRFKDGYRAIVIWAGDSRACALDAEMKLQTLTRDDVDEMGHLTAFYDAATGRFAGELHMEEVVFPRQPLAFGVTTDGFHDSCESGEMSSFLAYNLLQPDCDFMETTQEFIALNISDNATCGFVLRKNRLPKKELEQIVRGER